MASNAYRHWVEDRLGTIEALRDAHRAVGGDERGRRWTTAELDRLMVVAAVGEFSAYLRDLFTEEVQILTSIPQPLALPAQQLVAALAVSTARTFTNPWPDQIGKLFRGVGMTQNHAFWAMPDLAKHVPGDRDALKDVVELRNSLAHGGTEPVTLSDVRRHVRLLKRVARSADRSVGRFLVAVLGSRPWPARYDPLGRPFT